MSQWQHWTTSRQAGKVPKRRGTEEVSVVNDPAPASRAPPEDSKPRIPGDRGDQSWPCSEERAAKSVQKPATCDGVARALRTLLRGRPATNGRESHLQSTRAGTPLLPPQERKGLRTPGATPALQGRSAAGPEQSQTKERCFGPSLQSLKASLRKIKMFTT